jgi:hypothetical protein
VSSTRQITAILRVRSRTQTISLDLRSWPQRGTMTQLSSATPAMTWRSLPSPHWRHVSGRSRTRQLKAQHPKVRRPFRSQHLAVDLLRHRQGGRWQLRPHGVLLPAGDGRRTIILARQPPGRQHHVVGRLS